MVALSYCVISPEIVGEPLALRVPPSSLNGPEISSAACQIQDTILQPFSTSGLPEALLNVPAPPIARVCAPTVRFPTGIGQRSACSWNGKQWHCLQH